MELHEYPIWTKKSSLKLFLWFIVTLLHFILTLRKTSFNLSNSIFMYNLASQSVVVPLTYLWLYHLFPHLAKYLNIEVKILKLLSIAAASDCCKAIWSRGRYTVVIPTGWKVKKRFTVEEQRQEKNGFRRKKIVVITWFICHYCVTI